MSKPKQRLQTPNRIEIEDEEESMGKPDEVREQEAGWVTAGTIEIPIPDRPPQEAPLYLSGGSAREAELDARIDKAAEETDPLSPSMVREQMAQLQATIEKQNLIITQLVAKVGAIALPKEPDRDTQQYLTDQMRTLLAGRRSAKIIIQVSDDPAKNYPVMVGVNGRNWELPRGQVVDVPVEVIEVLSNARVEGTQMHVTPEGDRRVVQVNQLRFPFTIWQ